MEPAPGPFRPHPLSVDFTWRRPTTTPTLLDATQVERYHRDGYLLVEDVIDTGTIEQLRDAIDVEEAAAEDALRQLPGKTMFIATADQITFTVHLVTRSAEARRFVRHPALVGICHDLVGPDVRLYWDQAVYKKPEPHREFPWHQDNGYAFIEPQQYLTCWVPLTDATVDNGCPWVLPGVHLQGTLEHRPTAVGLQCLDAVDGAIPIEAGVGSVVVFSSLTPHRTGPNRTDSTRKSYIVQYAPDGARVVDGSSGRSTAQDDPDRQFPVLVGGHPLAG